MSESTLDSDQGNEKTRKWSEILQNYVSIRLTTPKKWHELVKVVEGFGWYIGYPYIGKDGNNPHHHKFHVDVSETGVKGDLERIRIQIKKCGLYGNKFFSGKCM